MNSPHAPQARLEAVRAAWLAEAASMTRAMAYPTASHGLDGHSRAKDESSQGRIWLPALMYSRSWLEDLDYPTGAI